MSMRKIAVIALRRAYLWAAAQRLAAGVRESVSAAMDVIYNRRLPRLKETNPTVTIQAGTVRGADRLSWPDLTAAHHRWMSGLAPQAFERNRSADG